MEAWRRRLPQSIGQVLDRGISEQPDRDALVSADGSMTYSELDAAAENAASVLASAGLGAGDTLAVSLPNRAAIVVTFHAAMRIGAIWVGVNRALATPEKEYILDDCAATLVLADAGVTEDLHSVGDRRPIIVIDPGHPSDSWQLLADQASGTSYNRCIGDLDDPAGIAYTSGTTGRPKGVVHSQRNLLLPGAVLVAARGFGPDLRKGDCAALTILNMQVNSTLLVSQAAGTQVVMDRVDPVGIATWIRDARVSSWFGVPTMLHSLATSNEVKRSDLATLEDVWSGGAHVPASIRAAFEERFERRVYATYGSTEVPTVVTIEGRDDELSSGSSGRVLPHLSLQIRDADGRPVARGAEGEITIEACEDGPWAGAYRPMLRYHHDPAGTVATVRDGVLYTSDVGIVDEHGELHVRDRKQSLILRGGANVYPAEVERVLYELPGIAGASVVGVDDERLGQRVAAAVELLPGEELSQEELVAHCRAQLARYKVPERWTFGELPRNAMGKVKRQEVEGWFARDAPDSSAFEVH
jgi:long-chain acyl-CoA synthetase